MTESSGVLRRKLTPAAAAPPGKMSAEKAMAIAFGRAAREVPGLGLRMTGFARETSELADLLAEFGQDSLGMLLLQAGKGGTDPLPSRLAAPPRRFGEALGEEAALHGGLVIADAGLVSALVEARLTGHVLPSEPHQRPATRIDALIVAGVVDAALAQFDRLVGDLSIAPLVSQWRAGAMVPGAASVKLTLRDGFYLCFALDFDLADGARQGRLVLALPERAPAPNDYAAGEDQKTGDLAQIVLQARSDLHAVLARMQLPLSRLTSWQAGDTIPIPRAALSLVRIEDIDGALVGRGRLGQLSGSRAVRISGAAEEGDFTLPGPDETRPAVAFSYAGRV